MGYHPAVRYLCLRLGHGLLVLAGVSALTFALAELAPGSVFDEARLDPRISAETVAAMRDRYGLDRSLPDKYFHWLQSIPRGELGFSVAYDSPVGPLLWPRARNTLLLTIPATALAWCIAVPVGAWAASRPGGLADRSAAAATTALLSVPDLLLGLSLLLLAVRSGLFPTGGMISLGFGELGPWEKAKDVVSHFFLPVAALTLINLPVLVRHVRASLLDVLRAPFIQAALFLAFFMLTDPPTSPNQYGDQIWYGLLAAASACLAQLLGAGQVYLLIGVLVANIALAGVRVWRRRAAASRVAPTGWQTLTTE